ncbi:MAG: DUF1850 domain-containing protein [Clostridia bacterium]|nr:DUF1850 domain-containing protein [Clostridia bacterium]
MTKIQKRVITGVILCIVIGILISRTVKPSNILVVEDVITGKQTEIAVPSNTFVLGYIHSVLLTPAEEYFFIDEQQQLNLQKTIYESFGVGLPYSQDQDWEFEIVDGKFILYVDRTMDVINMVISPIPDHWIEAEGEIYKLIDLVSEPEDAIKIYAKKSYIFGL